MTFVEAGELPGAQNFRTCDVKGVKAARAKKSGVAPAETHCRTEHCLPTYTAADQPPCSNVGVEVGCGSSCIVLRKVPAKDSESHGITDFQFL